MFCQYLRVSHGEGVFDVKLHSSLQLCSKMGLFNFSDNI